VEEETSSSRKTKQKKQSSHGAWQGLACQMENPIIGHLVLFSLILILVVPLHTTIGPSRAYSVAVVNHPLFLTGATQ